MPGKACFQLSFLKLLDFNYATLNGFFSKLEFDCQRKRVICALVPDSDLRGSEQMTLPL